MANCYKATRDFLMDSFDLEEREAIGLMSVGVDFGVTEVVDGNWGKDVTLGSSSSIPIRNALVE